MPLQNDFIFSENQALSGSSPIQSTNIVKWPDLEDTFGNVITPDEGESARLYWNVVITETLVDGTDLITYYVTKEANGTLTTGGTNAGQIIFPAESVAGTKFSGPLPFGTLYKYQGIVYTPDALTSGAVTAYLSIDHESPTK